MNIAFSDFHLMRQADSDGSYSLRGWVRLCRRIGKRCRSGGQVVQRPRIFCQNSGNCGSTYVVRLLQANGVERAFHERAPDLLQTGLDHFEKALPQARLVRLLRYTRHDVDFEANNRLFSLSRELHVAFPGARFIHLYRDPAEVIRSGLSRPDLHEYLRTAVRFEGTLAGSRSAKPIERLCHHWANMNRRIADDLASLAEPTQVVRLRFEDLIAGRLDSLEQLLECRLKVRSCSPANRSPVKADGRFPGYNDWAPEDKAVFSRVCGPVLERLG